MLDVESFWGCVWSIFGRFGGSWEVFSRSWGVLGGSWRGLGGSWDRLGSLLGRLGPPQVVIGHFKPTGPCEPRDLGALWGAKMEPKWNPRRTKIDVKNEVETKRLFKIVLEPSWVDLGSFWGSSWRAKIV